MSTEEEDIAALNAFIKKQHPHITKDWKPKSDEKKAVFYNETSVPLSAFPSIAFENILPVQRKGNKWVSPRTQDRDMDPEESVLPKINFSVLPKINFTELPQPSSFIAPPQVQQNDKYRLKSNPFSTPVVEKKPKIIADTEKPPIKRVFRFDETD